MLSLARLIPAADRAMKDAKWEKKKFLGTELRGKTLGVAGLGRIGQEVALRARAFGMRVVAHDPFISKEIAAGVGAELMSLDAMCAAADYITLHLPSTAETKHLFNDERFALQARNPAHQYGKASSWTKTRCAARSTWNRRGRGARCVREGTTI
jgi:D-3-phosphoglycerate dehydrogenase